MAQIMFATKIIYEEKFIHKYSIQPAQFLGCEGITADTALLFFSSFICVGDLSGEMISALVSHGEGQWFKSGQSCAVEMGTWLLL